jgi:formate dehydrogenase subunit beta
MNSVIPIENNDVLSALRGFLRKLMESDLVDALLVPLETGDGLVQPALVSDPSLLEVANPLLPIMPINNARAMSALTGKHAPARIGAVLRPCEIRALVELVKLQQTSLEDVLLIGLDCPGTYELPESMALGACNGENRSDNLTTYLSAAHDGKEAEIKDLPLRPACQMCIHPVPENVDIHIHLFGADSTVVLALTLKDELAAKLQLTEAPAGEAWNPEQGRETAGRIIAGRKQVREKELGAIRTRMTSNGGIAGLFAACIRCHNCMTACPICYCKTCLFKTTSFDHEPAYYLNAARRKGAQRMLGDTLLFQMTRLNHMSASCVSCGMCTSACPSDIPVGAIFSAIGEYVQAAFEYTPGKDVNEPLPLITFQPHEWNEVGEEK